MELFERHGRGRGSIVTYQEVRLALCGRWGMEGGGSCGYDTYQPLNDDGASGSNAVKGVDGSTFVVVAAEDWTWSGGLWLARGGIVVP